MAIPFLNHLDLRSVSELQNAILHKTTTATASNVEGKFLYDTGTNSLQYYNGVTWINLDGSGDISEVVAGTYLNGGGASGAVTLNHDATDRTDTTSSDSPGYGGTFEAVTSVTTNATGHVTAIDVSTVTIPANSDQTVTLTGDVTGTGTTSIATTISAGAVDFAMLNSTDVITAVEGIENNDNDVTIPTSAAVKAYADSLIVGGLIYQGGFDGSTGYVAGTTNYLDSRGTQIEVNKGWTYTVTVAGTFYGENVEVGDVLIAEDNLASGTGTLGDWTTVQNNIDLASDSQVGIGNVKAATTAPLTGLSVTYASGTATAGLDISGLTTQAPANNALAFIPFYDQTAGSNLKVGLSTLAGDLNEFTSKAFTISDTDTITHGYNTRDVIVQLYDTDTYETVYADVDRISTTQVTITFAATPSNDIKVLVQKIG